MKHKNVLITHATSAQSWHWVMFMYDRDEQPLSLSNVALPETVSRFQGAVFQ
jgi:hypothetical protein